MRRSVLLQGNFLLCLRMFSWKKFLKIGYSFLEKLFQILSNCGIIRCVNNLIGKGDFCMEETEKKNKVNKIVYILIAFFVGLFGVHRFIAGHWFAGLCYLATFIIGSLLTFFFGLGFIILSIEGLVCLYDIVKAAITTADDRGDIVI